MDNIESRYISRLKNLGFSVDYTDGGRAGKSANKFTWTIKKNGRWLGVVSDKELNKAEGEKSYLTYRFHRGWQKNGNEKRLPVVEEGFDFKSFCFRYGLNEHLVRSMPDGNSGNSYFRVFDEDTAVSLLEQAAIEPLELIGEGMDALAMVHKIDVKSNTEEAIADIDEINRRNLPPATRKALVDARLGQGKYRHQLDNLFAYQCAATGIPLRESLRASHILAFKDSDDRQKLDPYNGLLLCVALDALFDKHLISFNAQGHIMLSKRLKALKPSMLAVLAPFNDLRSKPMGEQVFYLRLHNEKFQQLEISVTY